MTNYEDDTRYTTVYPDNNGLVGAIKAMEIANEELRKDNARLRADNAELRAKLDGIVRTWDVYRSKGVLSGAAGYFEFTKAIDAARKEERMKPLCGSRGFSGPSACILRAGHEGPHQYGNFASAVQKDQDEELARLRAQLEMGQKHGEVLQRIGTALGLSGGDDLHQRCVPEIERLRAEIAALIAQLDDTHARMSDLRKDAERYRWLRNQPTWVGYDDDFRPDELDAAIDAERNHSEPVQNEPAGE